MTSPQDKPATVEERFDATCASHGLTPEDVRRIGVSPEGQAILHDIAKEAGITTQEHDAWANRNLGKIDAVPRAIAGGLAGGGIGAAAVCVRQLLKDGEVSRKAFAGTAPKTVAIGVVLGGLAGIAAARMTNVANAGRMRDASVQWGEQEAAWAKKEAGKKDAFFRTLPPGK